MKKILIFDFDGTIADTKSIYYKATYDAVKKFGYSYKEVDDVIDLGINLKSVLRKLGLSFITTLFLHKKIMSNIHKYADEVKKCKDVDSIKDIKEDKILITNSLKEFVIPILKHFNLNCFKEIYGAEDFGDKSKFIKEYLNKNRIKGKDCYYIGDRASDAKIAKKAGCNSIIISGKCAWDSRDEILKAKPDFIIGDIKDLNKII
ncbi:MAG: HAD hydrolase-like protein [Nanoarchaeota archaeon]|nr:HAD hydrolase-like protein [Nanoarchaeota archaeon]